MHSLVGGKYAQKHIRKTSKIKVQNLFLKWGQ